MNSFGRRIDDDIQENRVLIWKQIQDAMEENKENLYRIMNFNGAFITNEMKVRKRWREHFENLNNISSDEEVIMNLSGFMF